ncbi:MAG: HlyC/CorC family transporter [Chitinophagaceae bacterium]|nr:HlyC/CorC family transporter [Chitinophagaceae bacterium]MCW5914070.1 HlyC/CorC family transporter [Chitinophagaceae bacterium]MCZ2396051.1 hemolysin family protein [Chitinophagales bacterium]
MTEVLIILTLILVNGLIVLSETALISSKKSRLEVWSEKGDSKAKCALDLKEDPDVFLSTTQIYITLVGILTGVYSGERFSHYLAPYIERIEFLKPYSSAIALVIIVIVVTLLTILFGELVPKRIAILNPEGIARVVARPIRTLSKVSYPLVWLLSSLNGGIFNLLKIEDSEENAVTEEEIKAMINEGSESGTIEEEEKDIIERVFHLGDRNITSMMTHRTDIVWFEVNESRESVRSKIEEYLHSVYPVCRGNIDDIEGVVHVKDLYLYPDKPLSSLCRKPLFVPENNSAYQVLEKIKNTKIHHAFIVDEYGSLQGMITARDILRAIVGEIPEEEDDEYVIVKRSDNTYLVDAQIQFYDFLSYFEKSSWISESENEFDTLAGFVLHTLERIPNEGDKFSWRGFDFEIVDMDGQRIDKIIVQISEEIRAEMEEDEGEA